MPHRLIVSYSYDLPIGKGKRFASGVSGVADKLMAGWGVDGIRPSNPLSAFGFGTLRPKYVSGCDPSEPGSSQQKLTGWFNTACFVSPPSGTLGNLGRTFTGVRSPGIANYDFSVFKSTALSERFSVQFRAEFFNIFNRVQFGPPGEVAGDAQFGIVSTQTESSETDSVLDAPQLLNYRRDPLLAVRDTVGVFETFAYQYTTATSP